ncbi:MAG TPA: hypothetical protein VNT26_13415, partial [Candidatus Sulfotelmatobacter sp.]|nr:hypothetical protein [Candidatus Sulfotelmatobacter sp.]
VGTRSTASLNRKKTLTSPSPPSLNSQLIMTAPQLPVSQPSALNPQPSTHRRIGKIARLPKSTRDQINQRILDGAPYRDIIAQLGLAVWDITEDNLCSWKNGGYQDWLRARKWRAQLRSQLDLAAELVPQSDFAAIHQASLQLALTQLTASLRLSGHRLAAQAPQTYLRLLLTLCRLNQEVLRYEKHRQTSAPTQQKPEPRPSPQSGPSSPNRRTAIDKLRRLLGL